MTFQNKHFIIIPGLRSEQLTEKVKEVLLFSNPENEDQRQLEMRYGSGSIKIKVTKTGDIEAGVTGKICGEDVYILQEMNENPWQELAALCIAAETAKQNGARTVTGIVPVWKLGRYACNTLHTQAMDSTRLTARMLSDSGVDQLVTLTPTQEMQSSLYPVQVDVPDASDAFARVIRNDIGERGIPIVLADSPESLAQTQRISQLFGWDADLAWHQKDGWHIGSDYRGRDIVIVSSHVRSSLPELANYLVSSGCGSLCCYAPCIEDPYQVKTERYSFFPVIITPDTVPADSLLQEYIHSLPIDQILVQWLCRDRLDPVGM